MVLNTCEKMAAGGIHDQLGGGFARYAVDAQWLVPHFEKMLYDNAQLVQLYLDAHLVALERRAPARRVGDGGRAELVLGAPFEEQLAQGTAFVASARDILEYVLRDMTHPDGGFYSAEDADSEGHEGKFYCWTQEELSSLLTPQEFAVAKTYFGITKNGNFVDHSHPHPLPGQNVLSVVQPVGLNETDRLESAKKKMLAVRDKRVRPLRDDKILASWNGLMLGAFARAAVVLGDERYRAAAEKNLQFIREHLWQEETKTLFHRWREGERDSVQLLEGYAFLLDGVLHLYEATVEPGHLEFAVALAEAMLAKFYDPANGGFWQSPASTDGLILRVKDDYDGAEPSGNSVATFALLRLAAITGREDLKQPAEATLQLFAARLQQQPAAMAFMLQALDFWLEEPRRVVLAGDAHSALLGELLIATHSVYQPNKIVLGNVGLVEPFARTLTAKGEATVYLCTGNSCQPPTSEAEKVREWVR
jgi:hypothetical protein